MKKKTFLVSALSAFLLVLSACNGAVIDSSSSGSKSDSSASSSQPTTSSGGGGGGGSSSIAPSSSDEPSSSSQEESSSEEQPSSSQEESSSEEQPSSSQEESSSSESGSSSSEVVTQYTITYAASEGTGIMNPVVVDAGSEHTLLPCGFTREGYHFDYWQVGNDAAHRAAGDKITVNGNVTVTAKWAQDEPAPVKTLVSIDVANTKTEYTVGDEFDNSALTVTGNYSDETQEVIPTNGYTVTGFDSSAAVASQELTVTVKETTISKKITISIVEPTPAFVPGIFVSNDNWETQTKVDLGPGTSAGSYVKENYELHVGESFYVQAAPEKWFHFNDATFGGAYSTSCFVPGVSDNLNVAKTGKYTFLINPDLDTFIIASDYDQEDYVVVGIEGQSPKSLTYNATLGAFVGSVSGVAGKQVGVKIGETEYYNETDKMYLHEKLPAVNNLEYSTDKYLIKRDIEDAQIEVYLGEGGAISVFLETQIHYYVVGVINSETKWAATDYELKENTTKAGEYLLDDYLALKNEDEVKVMDNLGNYYPAAEAKKVSITADGEYMVYFRPDGQGGEGWYEGYLYVEAKPVPTVRTAVVTGSTPTHDVYAFGWDNGDGKYLAEVTDFASETNTYTFDFGSSTNAVTGFKLIEIRDNVPSSSKNAAYVNNHWSEVVLRQSNNLTFASNEGAWEAIVTKVFVAPNGVWDDQVQYDLTYVPAQSSYVSNPIELHVGDKVFAAVENYYLHYAELSELLCTPETYASFSPDGDGNLVVSVADTYTFYGNIGILNIVSESDLHRVTAKKNETKITVTDIKDPGSEYYAEYEVYLANGEFIEFFDKDDFALDLYYGSDPAAKKFTSSDSRYYHFNLTNDNKIYIVDSTVTSKTVTVDETIASGNSVKVWAWNNAKTFGKVYDTVYENKNVTFDFGGDYATIDQFLLVEVIVGQTFDGSTESWKDTVIAKQTYDYGKDASACIWKKANNIFVNLASNPLVEDKDNVGYFKSETLTLYRGDTLYIEVHDSTEAHCLHHDNLDTDRTAAAVQAYFGETGENKDFLVIQDGKYIFHANTEGVFIELVEIIPDYTLYKLAYGSAVGGTTDKWSWTNALPGVHTDIEEVGAIGQVEYTVEVSEPINMKVVSHQNVYFGDIYAASPFNNGDGYDDNIFLDAGTYSIYFKIYTDHYAIAITRNTKGLSLYVGDQWKASKLPSEKVDGKYVFEVENLQAGNVLSFSYPEDVYTKDTEMPNNNLTDGLAIIVGGNLTITVNPTTLKVGVNGYSNNYSLTVGGNTITEFIDASSDDKMGDNWIYQYKFEDVDLTRNQELIFKLGTSPILISETTGDNCNARVEEDGEHVKHVYVQTTAQSDIYLKVYAGNVYKIYVSDIDTKYYVIGTFNDWTTSATYKLEDIGGGEYVARGISVTAGDKFKIFSAGVYYPASDDLVIPAEKTGIYNMYLYPAGGHKDWDAPGYFYLAGVASISVAPATFNITAGQSIGSSAISVSATYSDSAVVNNIPLSQVRFEDSEKNPIADITSKVYDEAGNYVIIAIYGGQSTTFTIAVSAVVISATSVTIKYNSEPYHAGSLFVEDELQLTATVEPANTTELNLLRWMSTNEAKATVTQTGLVTAVAAGDVVIKAYIDKNGNGEFDEATETVVDNCALTIKVHTYFTAKINDTGDAITFDPIEKSDSWVSHSEINFKAGDTLAVYYDGVKQTYTAVVTAENHNNLDDTDGIITAGKCLVYLNPTSETAGTIWVEGYARITYNGTSYAATHRFEENPENETYFIKVPVTSGTYVTAGVIGGANKVLTLDNGYENNLRVIDDKLTILSDAEEATIYMHDFDGYSVWATGYDDNKYSVNGVAAANAMEHSEIPPEGVSDQYHKQLDAKGGDLITFYDNGFAITVSEATGNAEIRDGKVYILVDCDGCDLYLKKYSNNTYKLWASGLNGYYLRSKTGAFNASKVLVDTGETKHVDEHDYKQYVVKNVILANGDKINFFSESGYSMESDYTVPEAKAGTYDIYFVNEGGVEGWESGGKFYLDKKTLNATYNGVSLVVNEGKINKADIEAHLTFGVSGDELVQNTALLDLYFEDALINTSTFTFSSTGNKTVQVRYVGLSANITIPVVNAQLHATGVTLNKTSATAYTDIQFELTATITPDGCTDPVTWESSDTTVATVSGGVVTPKKAGTATITVTVGDFDASCVVTVKEAGYYLVYQDSDSNPVEVKLEAAGQDSSKHDQYKATISPKTGSTLSFSLNGSPITFNGEAGANLSDGKIASGGPNLDIYLKDFTAGNYSLWVNAPTYGLYLNNVLQDVTSNIPKGWESNKAVYIVNVAAADTTVKIMLGYDTTYTYDTKLSAGNYYVGLNGSNEVYATKLADNYYVLGDFNGWSATDSAKMTLTKYGYFEKVIETTEADQKLKVNDGATAWYGEGGSSDGNMNIGIVGTYLIKFYAIGNGSGKYIVCEPYSA